MVEPKQAGALLRKLTRIARDPAAAWERFYDRWDRQREYARAPCIYHPEPDWERRLHEQIGAAWPCPLAQPFGQLWPKIGDIIASKGYRFGPESFYGFNDGDPEFARAIWCLVCHLQPDRVVETGVAHGVTTRVILEALERNRRGRLWSIDLVPADQAMAAQIGIAAAGFADERWRLMPGSSRQILPGLLAQLGQIDLFVHDSLHTRRNVCFEVAAARRALQPGGFIVIDDIDTNWGFDALRNERPEDSFLVCQSVPVRPDLRRFDDKGLFGVIRPQIAGPGQA